MTAHDGLGSVRADRRKDLEAALSTPARSTAVGALIATGGLISELMEIQDNVLILAEQRDQAEAERDAARAELTAIREGIKALADEWQDGLADGPCGANACESCVRGEAAIELRALLNGADQ